MDQPSEKKPRKLPKDTDPWKKTSSSSHRQENSYHASSSHPSSSSSHPMTSSDPGTQRKHHWQTIMQSSVPTTASSSHRSSQNNFKNISANPKRPFTSSSLKNMPKSSSSSTKRRQPSSRAPLRPVPIAPSGPVLEPREDYDGYRFKCPEEGCQQRFRHRSSRSRHKKNCPMRRDHNNH